jgi:hypothetical protein
VPSVATIAPRHLLPAAGFSHHAVRKAPPANTARGSLGVASIVPSGALRTVTVPSASTSETATTPKIGATKTKRPVVGSRAASWSRRHSTSSSAEPSGPPAARTPSASSRRRKR